MVRQASSLSLLEGSDMACRYNLLGQSGGGRTTILPIGPQKD